MLEWAGIRLTVSSVRDRYGMVMIEEVYEAHKRNADPNYKLEPPNYYRDIFPLFQRMYMTSWTNKTAMKGHSTC